VAEEARSRGGSADVSRAHHKDREWFDIRHVAIVHVWAGNGRQSLNTDWEVLRANWEIKGVSCTNDWQSRRRLLGHSKNSNAGFVSLSRRRRQPKLGVNRYRQLVLCKVDWEVCDSTRGMRLCYVASQYIL
jgi:hypothetical protein